MNLLLGFSVKAWRWSQTQLPLLLHTDPHRQYNKGNKAVRVEIIFLLNYCQYCLHGYLVKIALEYRGDSGVNQFEEQSEKPKDSMLNGSR